MPAPHPRPVQAPAPRRSSGAQIALVATLVVALGVIGVAIASPESIRSALPGAETVAPTTTARTTSAAASTTRTTTSRAASTPTTTTSPSFQPVPIGEPALTANPILQAGGMQKQVCGPPDYPGDGPAGEAFYAAALPCVERAWQPLFERVRMEYDAPKVMVPAGTTATSPCGTTSTAEAAAFYCPVNETIYMPIAGLPEAWTEGRPLNYLSVFAHEFGHHVQGLTGVLDEAYSRERRVGRDSPAGLEISRRTELQVQCFAGMFVESIVDSGGPFTRPDIDSVRRFEYGSGTGSPTHGTAANVEGWWVRGIRNQIADCNTWSASSAEVA
ncbi:MAG: hypothetical protein K0R68_58 [Mycobacterium sp.]|jgi:hypothetical protein|nr:hypothetical protein [Mycobacterium sp.]